MFLGHEKDVDKIRYDGDNIKSVIKQSLIGPEQGWNGYVMRLFTVEEGGFTPRHSHPWPHINYIISGKGSVYLSGKEYEIGAGSIAYVPNNTAHQFMANKGETLKFICIVPEEGDK